MKGNTDKATLVKCNFATNLRFLSAKIRRKKYQNLHTGILSRKKLAIYVYN